MFTKLQMAKWLSPLLAGTLVGPFVAYGIIGFNVLGTPFDRLLLIFLYPVVCFLTGIVTIFFTAWKVKVSFRYAIFAPWLTYFVFSCFQAFTLNPQEVISLVIVTCLAGLPYIFASLGGLVAFGLLPRSRVVEVTS
jgi:hypothetical protein